MLSRILLCFFALFISVSVAAKPTVVNAPTIVNENMINPPIISYTEISVSNAAVKVMTSEGHGSGTLFSWNGYLFVVTANHVLDKTNRVTITSDCGSTPGEAIYRDANADIAIVSGEKYCETPMQYKPLHRIPGIGTDIEFTSYPSMHSKILLRGEIAGYHEAQKDFYILVQGFAWPGSSGAAVFDNDGNFIGIISGVDISQTKLGPVVVPDIVWIKPSCLIDEQTLLEALISNK